MMRFVRSLLQFYSHKYIDLDKFAVNLNEPKLKSFDVAHVYADFIGSADGEMVHGMDDW